MSKSIRRSRPVIEDNEVFNARRASGKPKSNATSFKKRRTKTGGRKAGTPNKTTMFFREAILAAAEAAGNETGRDGHIGYLTEVALKCPSTFLPLYARAMPQQPEPEQTSPSEEKVPIEDVGEYLRQIGIPLVSYVLAIPRRMTLEEQEQFRNRWPTPSTDDRCVKDDDSDATRGK